MIFPRYYTDQLTDIFLKKEKSITQDDVDGESTGDIDGEPMDDIDGEPMGDIDGEPMGDIDGEPMDDIDGEPMDDSDGEPVNMSQQIQKHKEVQSLYTEVKDMFA
jgi:U2-associated protein SR140